MSIFCSSLFVLLAIVLSVFPLRYTDSDYPFGIFLDISCHGHFGICIHPLIFCVFVLMCTSNCSVDCDKDAKTVICQQCHQYQHKEQPSSYLRSLNIKETTTFETQVQAWDKHQYLVVLNRKMEFQPSCT